MKKRVEYAALHTSETRLPEHDACNDILIGADFHAFVILTATLFTFHFSMILALVSGD